METESMNADKAKIIIERIALGMSLRKATEFNEPCSMGVFLGWVNNTPKLAEQYARARDLRADIIFEDLETLANQEPMVNDGKVDSGWVQMQRLKIDTFKWQLGKMKPKVYGDKLDVTSGGDKISININVD
jgi:hypothetical protein